MYKIGNIYFIAATAVIGGEFHSSPGPVAGY